MISILFDLLMAVVLSVGIIVFGPTGMTLLLCAVVGGLLRLRFDHESAVFLGSWATGLLLAIDSVIFAIILASEPTGIDDTMPRYYIILVPLVGWFVHLPIGLLLVRLGVRVSAWGIYKRAGRRFSSN